jgi:hypothetical protein
MYDLLRASFWSGSELATASGNLASFRIVIDSYVGPQLNFSLPMTVGFFAEYYVKALDGSSSITMCLSALGTHIKHFTFSLLYLLSHGDQFWPLEDVNISFFLFVGT